MAAEPRKLAAIVAVDIAGYSALSERDETAAVAAVGTVRAAIEALCARSSGRLFNTAGDGFMIEFASALDAVRFGVALLRRLTLGPAVRIGAHLGEVRPTISGDLLGHGVNVAARLMSLAEPRALLISEAVCQPLPARVRRLFRGQGPVQLHKMQETVTVHGLAGRIGLSGRLRLARRRPWALGLLAGLAVLLAAAAFWPRPDPHPMVAVLPFEAQSPQAQAMATGLADDVIMSLSAAPGLRVAARNSSFAFGPERRGDAARALRARYLLDGSVRLENSQVLVNAQLSDARRNNAVVWSQSFSSSAAETSLTQRRIAQAVAAAVVGADAKPLEQDAPVSEEAVALYYAGREARLRRSAVDLEQAIVMLTRATQAAPRFDRAWAELAGAQLILADRMPARAEALRLAAADNAGKALGLNPSNAYAMAVRAGLEPPQAWAARRTWLDRAVESASSDAVVRRARARLYSNLGYLNAAMADLNEAAALDPLDPQVLLIWTREALGDRMEARAQLARSRLAQDPASWNTRFLFALFDQDYNGAASLLDARVRPMEMSEATVARFAATSDALRIRARRPAAIAMWQAAARADPSLVDDAFLMIGWLGDLDAAYGLATEAMAAQGQALVFPADIAAAPAFRPILHDRRYLTLMAHSGLMAYWRAQGVWPDFCADPRLPYRCEDAAT
jgi:TolB-like protein